MIPLALIWTTLKPYWPILAIILGAATVTAFLGGWQAHKIVVRAELAKEYKQANKDLVDSQAKTNVIAGNTEKANIETNAEALKHDQELEKENEKAPLNCIYSTERVRIINEAFGTK